MKNWKDIVQYTTAQTLIYAASIFGVTMYWNGKYSELRQMVRNGNTSVASSSPKEAI